MKEFDCGTVVPGCKTHFRADSEEQLLAEVAEHARVDHGLGELSPELVGRVRANIRDVSG